MKKTFVSLLFSITFISLVAQNAFTFGVKYGIMHPDNINRTVYSYNYARQWLTTKMPYFKVMHGYEASWQHRGETLGYEVLYASMKEENEASGLEPTTGMVAYRKITLARGGLSVGFTATIFERKHLAIVPVLDFDFHFLSGTTTYSHDPTYAGASDEGVIHQFKMANTLGLNCSLFATQWFGINIRPYAQLPWGKTNVEGLAAYWGGSGTGAQRERIRNYGVSASVIFEFGRDF